MVRKFVSATVSAALCFAFATPAMAQDYRFAGYDAPQGATATVNLRVPLGRVQAAKPTYGLTLGYGRTYGSPALDGRTVSRALTLGDFRFSGNQLQSARLASFDLAHLDQDRRLNLMGGGGKKSWLVIGGIVVAGVLICLAADCFGDGDDEDSIESPGTSG
jgi:hypothetical protein